MTDLLTGQVVESKGEKTIAFSRPTREIEYYKGEPPQNNDGKIPQVFNIQKTCNIEDEDKHGKKFKCNAKLQVVRVKNAKFEWDDTHTGGQLNYDEKDVKQYVRCPIHGPNAEALPTRW